MRTRLAETAAISSTRFVHGMKNESMKTKGEKDREKWTESERERERFTLRGGSVGLCYDWCRMRVRGTVVNYRL